MSVSLISQSDWQLLEHVWSQPVERRVLPNGLTLLVQTGGRAPVASVQVWVKTGSIHEGPLLGSGVSHFLEHMLFKGTKTRAGRDLSASIQARGGNLNAYTTFDRTVYYADLPADHATFAIEVLADMVLNSTLPADEVIKERDVILREIAMSDDDPDRRFSEMIFETTFRSHAYRYPVIGYKEVFSDLTREDLLSYYQSRYVPSNIVVVVTGAVDVAQVGLAVDQFFGTASRTRMAPVVVPQEPKQLAPRSRHEWQEVEIVRAGISWQIPGMEHPDAPLFDLLATVLGNGDSSPLWQSVREKARLVHYIDASCWNPGEKGLFFISFNCDSGKREQATAKVREELQQIAETGFKVADIRKAVRQLLVGEINGRKTVSGRASRLGAAEVVVGDQGFSRYWFERLRHATSEELVGVVKNWLNDSTCTEVSINPVSARPALVQSKTLAEKDVGETTIKLPNGTRLVLLPDDSQPNLHLRLLLQGGPMWEPVDKRGISSLLATLLTKDAGKRSSAEVALRIEQAGGSFYPFAGNNSLGLAVEVLPSDLALALDLMSEAMFEPTFKSRTLSIEKESHIAAIRQDMDDLVTEAQRLLRQAFFGQHPYAINPSGRIEDLNAIKPADLAGLWKQLLVGENVVLVASGDFDAKKTVPLLKKLLQKVPRGALSRTGRSFTLPAVVGERLETRRREQAVLFDAYEGPGLHDPDFFVSEVTDELLSGMSSRLFERVREDKGLAYFVRASRLSGLDTGMFYLYAGTQPGKESVVFAEFSAELERIKKGRVQEDELERCRTRLKAGRRMGLQTNGARAMHAGLGELLGLTAQSLSEYDAVIDAVSVKDVQAFARKRFQTKKRLRLQVGPQA